MTSHKIFAGGINELPNIREAKTPHHAVGIWWADAAANPGFNHALALDPAAERRQIALQAKALRGLRSVEQHAAGFALALEHLAYTEDSSRIATKQLELDESGLLARSAELTGMRYTEQSTFPHDSYTEIRGDVVIARLGAIGIEQQVWPPKS